MLNEGGNEGWERFRKRQGKTLKKILNKMRKQEKNKALQFKQFGNKKVAKDAVRARESFGEGIGAAYMPKAGKAGVPEREITSKAVKKQLNRNRNRSTIKGDLETPHVRYIHSRDKSTDYIRPEKKKRRFKKKVKEEVMIEGSKPNNPKLWAAKKAAAKAKFDVYPSAYANGWAAKQYKSAGGTWRSEGVEYPAGYESDMKRMGDKEKNTWWKSQDKAKVAADKKKKQMQKVNESGAAAIGLAKMVGGAAAKYAATKAAPYAAGAAAAYGAKKVIQKKLKDKKDQKMINKASDAAVAKYKEQEQQRESFGDRGLSLQELGDPNKMNQLFRMGLAKKGELPEVRTECSIEIHLMKNMVAGDDDEPDTIHPLRNNEMLMVNVATATSVGVVKNVEKNLATLQLRLPICADVGQRVSISRRTGSRWRLIGHATIV